MTLDQWLAIATRKLAPDSVAQVRAEIEEHREGDAVDVAALGDPTEANRAYRKVLLTEHEARMARVYMEPRPLSRAGEAKFLAIFMGSIFVLQLVADRHGIRPWILFGAFGIDGVVAILLPANLAQQYRWHWIARSVRIALLAVYFWETRMWNHAGFDFALVLLLFAYFGYQRRTILRKVNGGPVPTQPVPALTHASVSLTRMEANFLRCTTPGMVIVNRVMMLLAFALYATFSYFLPLIFGTFAVAMALRLALPFLVGVPTPASSRWFLRGKIAFAVLAVILPLFQFYFPPFGQMPADKLAGIILIGVGMNVCLVALSFFAIERPRASLRRKLPVEEWPRELYL